MKKIFILLMLIVFICCGCGKKDDEIYSNDLHTIIKRDKLIVGVKTDTYPFGYKDKKGRYMGYDAALGRLIAKGLLGDEKKIQFVPVTTSDRIMKLYSGDVDMLIATMTITPKRKDLIMFSKPYHVAGQAILVKKGSLIRNIQDLKEKKVAIIFGSTSEQSIRLAVPGVKIVGCKTYPAALQHLKSGKADAIVADDTILIGMALRDKSVELLPKRYSKEPYGVALRKGPESEDLLTAVNNVIDIETHNGHLKKIKASFGIK